MPTSMLVHHYSNHHHHHHLHPHQAPSSPPHQSSYSSPTYLDQHHQSPPTPETYPIPFTTSDDSPYRQLAETTLESTPDPEYFGLSQSTQDYYYMPTTPSYYPPIRVFQSISDQGDHQDSASSPALNEGDSFHHPWASFANANLKPSVRQQHLRFPHSQTSHKRNSSDSTVGSVGPHSPYTPTLSYPRIVDSDSPSYPSPNVENFDSAQYPGSSYSKPLPVSSHVPFQTFLAPAFQDYSPSTHNAEAFMAAHNAMTEVVMAQQTSDMSGGDNSAPRSSYSGDEYDENYRASIESRNIIPKLDRTMSEICQDELYNPNISTSMSTSQSRPSQNSMLSPYRGVFSERLRDANNEHMSGRSVSPVQRERSPFREGSGLSAGEYLHTNQRVPHISTASQLREQQKERTVAMVLAQHQNKNNHLVAQTTISPKETSLDYQETEDDARMPLFPQDKPRIRTKENRPSKLNLSKEMSSQDENDANIAEPSYSSMVSSSQSSSDYSTKKGSTQSRPNFNFVPPAVAGQVSIPQQYPFISQPRSQSVSSRIVSNQIPEFPAHLTSMDTTKSDPGTKSDNGQSESSPDISRPANTMADSGTYTCPYHGCTQRFATPTKLQKHKREGHRQSTPQTTPQGSIANVASPNGSTSNLANRNSQAGPHRCDRINPSTNKPCNSVFSRPYDLTRHEDTIHNARKQKVRCQLCTEEKTFSRNDALTRHMRVVHPEVDFPGKSKRKNGS